MRTSRRQLIVGALALIVVTATWLLLLRHNAWDVSRFVAAGDVFTDPRLAPSCLHVERGSGGYDGQFFYRLSVAPFSTSIGAYGIRFDYPVYRQQRILYPLVSFALAGGNPCAVLWSMTLVSVFAIVALGTLAGGFVGPEARSATLAVALWPGFLYSLSRDTAEPLTILLSVLGILACSRRHFGYAALAWSAAVLTRETSLLIPLTFAALELWRAVRERRPPRHLWVGLAPAVVMTSWKLLLFSIWSSPINFGSHVFAAPFSAPLALLRGSVRDGSHFANVTAIEILALAALGVLAALAAIRGGDPLLRAAWLAHTCFLWSLDPGIWIEDWAFMRAATDFGVLSLMLAASSTSRTHRVLAVLLSVGGWIAITSDFVRFR